MIVREELGSGEFLNEKGRLFLRSGQPEMSFIDDVIFDALAEHEEAVKESDKSISKYNRLTDIAVYALLAGLIVLGIIL